MTMEECYQQLGGNAAEVLERLISPAFIQKIIGKFPEDSSFQNLCKGIQDGQRENAFLAAHTLKGVCQNLGFGKLLVSVEKITELLRGEAEKIPASALPLLDEVRRDYEETVAVIRLYTGEHSL